MALIPVINALVNINAGEVTGSSYTVSNGIATVELRLTEEQYNKISLLTAVATKAGYSRGQSNISSLPSFASAVANGIDMNVRLVKSATGTFEISPGTLEFTSSGGTQNIIVTCPDTTWELYTYDNRLQVTRLNDTTIRVVCPSGSTETTYDSVYVRWFNNGAWQYKYCGVRRSAGATGGVIHFRGQLTDINTGAPLINQPSGSVLLYLNNHQSASSGTDANGRFDIVLYWTESTWNIIEIIKTWVIADGHSSGAMELVSPNIPTFSDAVTNGVDLGNHKLYPLSGGGGNVIFRGRMLNAGTFPQQPVVIEYPGISFRGLRSGEPYSAPGDILTYAGTDANGDYVVDTPITETEWNQYDRIKRVITPGIATPQTSERVVEKPTYGSATGSGVNFGNEQLLLL